MRDSAGAHALQSGELVWLNRQTKGNGPGDGCFGASRGFQPPSDASRDRNKMAGAPLTLSSVPRSAAAASSPGPRGAPPLQQKSAALPSRLIPQPVVPTCPVQLQTDFFHVSRFFMPLNVSHPAGTVHVRVFLGGGRGACARTPGEEAALTSWCLARLGISFPRHPDGGSMSPTDTSDAALAARCLYTKDAAFTPLITARLKRLQQYKRLLGDALQPHSTVGPI